MRISERLPNDVINLIIEVYDKSKAQMRQPKAALNDILDILPPRDVQKAVLAELGVIGNVPHAVKLEAAKWMESIVAVQTRAEKVIAKLYAIDPPSEVSARMGSLPAWLVESWAPYLNFAWSCRLPDSLRKAEEYLASREVRVDG